ncbi:TPA: serine protease [Vibrio cholerae]|nr:trypsin [Vibrio cholerae]HAS7807652.1 serine protease [Vibrio cholerae]
MGVIMNILSNLSIALISTTLAACASNGETKIASYDYPSIDFEITGIPPIYFGYGSSVPISEHLSLTAAHVAKLNYTRVIAYHPTCDIALVESDNRGKKMSKLGLVYPDQSLKTLGVDAVGRTIYGDGKYFTDLYFTNYEYFTKCPASITDAPIQSGMSGGGAYNSDGELVGIIAAMIDPHTVKIDGRPFKIADRLSAFVSINFIANWLYDSIEEYESSVGLKTWTRTLDIASGN